MIRPAWWPERIPFGDPNNSKPRLSAEQLHSIHAACSSYTLFSEDNTGVAQCDDCSEENHHDARDDDVREDVDVNNDASDDVDTINTEDYVVEDDFVMIVLVYMARNFGHPHRACAKFTNNMAANYTCELYEAND